VREEDVRSRLSPDRLFAASERGFSFHEIERFILIMVHVEPRRKPRRKDLFDQAKCPLGLLGGGWQDHQRPQEPDGNELRPHREADRGNHHPPRSDGASCTRHSFGEKKLCALAILRGNGRDGDSQGRPVVSTSTCRWRPLISLALSQPRLPGTAVVLTLWLSKQPAVGCL